MLSSGVTVLVTVVVVAVAVAELVVCGVQVVVVSVQVVCDALMRAIFLYYILYNTLLLIGLVGIFLVVVPSKVSQVKGW